MRLTQQLRKSLASIRNLLGLVLGMTWVLILVASHSVHPDTPLGDMELMKRFGGQSEGSAWCRNALEDCYDLACPTCTKAQVNGYCKNSSGVETVMSVSYYPEKCNTASGGQYCSITGLYTDVLCEQVSDCSCRDYNDGKGPHCVSFLSSSTCTEMDVGDDPPCPYTACDH